MKRVTKPEAESIARAILRRLICTHGERNINRITLALRRLARAQVEKEQ